MFRLTRVIFRLELYLFTRTLCSFWDRRRLHLFCIYIIYSIKNLNRGIYTYILLHAQCKRKKNGCSGVTHTNRAGAHSTSNPKPLSILSINTFRVISYNTVTMLFVKTFNCNTVDNIYVKTCKRLGSQNGHSDIVNIQGGAEPTDTFQMVIGNIWKQGKISETVYKYLQLCYLLPIDYKLIF